MNPDANNDHPGESFDFDAAEHQFDDVDIPTLDKDLSPTERHMIEKLGRGFETMEAGLRHTLAQVEAIREGDFEEVMRDPEKAERACEFADVLDNLPAGLAMMSLAFDAAWHNLGFCGDDHDLPEAA